MIKISSNKFNGRDYIEASKERILDAKKLLEKSENIIGAIYFSGVAVECIFRAYITLQSKEFDDKHDLSRLYETSMIGQKLDEREKKFFTVKFKCINSFWRNNLRYCSGVQLKRAMAHELVKEKKKFKNIYNYLNYKYKLLIEASESIVNMGVEEWN